MSQKKTWEQEYNKPQLIQISQEPRNDLKRYIKFLKKNEHVVFDGLKILDLGSGNGKHSNYLAQMGDNEVFGFDISLTAVRLAREQAKSLGISVDYRVADIGAKYPFENDNFDLVIDIMSSNSLHEKERAIYLKEVQRILKNGAHFFVRALCKDGDDNAKVLLKQHPGKEYDTYINKDMGLTERVFSREDFINTYSKYFKIQFLEKKTNYAKFKKQSYKRNYWLAYLKKVI
ncbi:class I SAM-dependent methyltransferase [Patescibacteria group bacterium]|nr:class I SAM-dependent methyltransferase [Patescibacteria group bacterium]